MKDLFEQLEEMSAKLADLKAFAEANASSEFESCCNGECECDVEENAPEYVEPEVDPYVAAAEAQMIVFTRAELIDFATRLTARVIISAKEAVTDTSIDADDLVSLELNTWNSNTIDIELDKDKLVECIHSEIDDAINVDSDSIEDEITDILSEIYSEIQS